MRRGLGEAGDGRSLTCPSFCSNCSPKRFPRACRARRRATSNAWSRDRLKEAGLAWERLEAFAGPRRLTLVARRPAGGAGGPGRGAQGPARQRARAGDPGLPALDRARPRAAGGARRRPLRPDRQDRAADRRNHRRNGRRDRARLPLAEVDDLGRGHAALGAAAAGASSACSTGEVVPFAIDGIESGEPDRGHRFMGPGEPFRVENFDDYRRKLDEAFVVLDAEGAQGAHPGADRRP